MASPRSFSAATKITGKPELVFYDGDCGLCHHAVIFLLARDRDGSRFRFAPLHGAAFDRHVPAEQQVGLPDSIVLLTQDGSVLVRSDAALHAGARLGGIWRPLATIARFAPRFLRDAVYDFIARIRHRLFRRPKQACPLIPPELRDRFDLTPRA